MFGLSRLLDRLPARRENERLRGVVNLSRQETAIAHRRMTVAEHEAHSLRNRLMGADAKIDELTRARDDLFRIARERRRLLREAGIKARSDTGRRVKKRPQIDEVIAVLRDDLVLAKARADAYAEALHAAGLPLPVVDPPGGSKAAALMLSDTEREIEDAKAAMANEGGPA